MKNLMIFQTKVLSKLKNDFCFGAGVFKTSVSDKGDVVSWALAKSVFNSPFLILHINPAPKRLRKIALLKRSIKKGRKK